MHRFVIKSLIAVATIVAIQGCKPSPEQINASVGTLMAVNKGIDSAYTELHNSYQTWNPQVMDKALEGMNAYLVEVSKILKDPNYPDDCQELKNAIVDKVIVLQQITSNESKEQVRIYKIPDSDFTEELRKQWDNIDESVTKKLENANSKVLKAKDDINNQNNKK